MKFVIFHGTYTSKNANWYDTFDAELTAVGHEVIRPQFPIDSFDEITALGEANAKELQNRKQSLTSWLDHYEKEVLPYCDEQTIFIAHSLGPVFTLHAMEKFPIKIKGAIFLAPFLDALPGTSWQFGLANSTFYSTEFNADSLRDCIPFSYVLYSTNDPYVPSTSSLKFAQLLDSTVIPVVDGHHLGGKYSRLPLVEELAKSIVGYEKSTSSEYIRS